MHTFMSMTTWTGYRSCAVQRSSASTPASSTWSPTMAASKGSRDPRRGRRGGGKFPTLWAHGPSQHTHTHTQTHRLDQTRTSTPPPFQIKPTVGKIEMFEPKVGLLRAEAWQPNSKGPEAWLVLNVSRESGGQPWLSTERTPS